MWFRGAKISGKAGYSLQRLITIGKIGRGVKAHTTPTHAVRSLRRLRRSVTCVCRYVFICKCLVLNTWPNEIAAFNQTLDGRKDISNQTASIPNHGRGLTVLRGVFLEGRIQAVELALHILQPFDFLRQRVIPSLKARTRFGTQRVQCAVLIGKNELSIGNLTDQTMRCHGGCQKTATFNFTHQLNKRAQSQFGNFCCLRLLTITFQLIRGRQGVQAVYAFFYQISNCC